MAKRICTIVLIVVALLASGAISSAQLQDKCRVTFDYWFWSFVPLPLGATCYPGPVWFFTPCTMPSAACPPYAAQSETCPTCPSATKPISLATGNTFIQEVDVRIAGLGGGLNLTRTWNSLWPATQAAMSIGLFGPNWRSTYEERVFLGSDSYIKYARGDGSFWSFGAGGPGWALAAPANASATLVQGNTSWMLTFQNGEKRQFNLTTGLLTAIIDRNGNAGNRTAVRLQR